MAAASLTDRRAVATAAGLGFVLVLAAASGLIMEVVGSAERYVELLQLPPTIINASNWIFGKPVGAPLPGPAYFGTVAGFVALFSAVVLRKYAAVRS
jgi:hypothetical protein